jgi:hypothetical protein
MASLRIAFLALQAFQVAFLFLHDWVPLGRLTNLAAVRAADSFQKRLWTTLLSGVPFAIGLWFSVVHANEFTFPYWLRAWLWISYGLLFAGELRAWWVPYLVWSDPERTARYRQRFAGTHKFLPDHHGIAPDTLHVILHAATLATLVLLFATMRSGL